METFTNEQLIAEIEASFLAIENKIAVERIIDKTWKEIWGDISSSVGTPAYTQANIRLQCFYKPRFKEIKTENNIKKIIALQVELDEFIKELDVTAPKYNWDNARKYQTPTNPEFLKSLEEFKAESSKAKTEYLIKNDNKVAESNGSGTKQQSVVRRVYA